MADAERRQVQIRGDEVWLQIVEPRSFARLGMLKPQTAGSCGDSGNSLFRRGLTDNNAFFVIAPKTHRGTQQSSVIWLGGQESRSVEACKEQL